MSFSEAKFGRSPAVLTPDLKTVYNVWNVQFRMDCEFVADLRSPGISNEEIADRFGAFMREEFLKAVNAHDERKRREWDEGEKVVTTYPDGSQMTSLKEESAPFFKPVKGKFERIG